MISNIILAALFRTPNSQDVKKLAKLFGAISKKITDTIQDPLARPRETVVIIGILVVLFLVLVTLLLMTATLKRDIEQAPPKKRKAKKKLSPRQLRIRYLIVGGVTFVVLLSGLVMTSDTRFCNQCHLMNKEYRTWKTSTHKKVSCLSCHTEPGLSGFILGKFKGMENMTAYLSQNYDKSLSAMVGNSSCLYCHRPRMEKTMAINGIRISHKEINEAGFFCTECHQGLVHQSKKKKLSMMDKCITCHDSQKASSDCKLCHPVDIAYRPGFSLKDFPKVRLDEPTSCHGCHSPEQDQACMDCHGLEMPHADQFKGSGHARSGFINKKVCYRCHPQPEFCAHCHLGVSGHTGVWGAHGPEWIRNHQTHSPSECLRGPCHNNANMCDLCHSKFTQTER